MNNSDPGSMRRSSPIFVNPDSAKKKYPELTSIEKNPMTIIDIYNYEDQLMLVKSSFSGKLLTSSATVRLRSLAAFMLVLGSWAIMVEISHFIPHKHRIENVGAVQVELVIESYVI
jgi:hypothetical protein